MNPLILTLVFIFILSFCLTYLYKYVALSHKLLDIPNERSSHRIPTPKGGGVAIVIAWYFGITVLFFLDFVPSKLYLALMSGFILAVISFIDDIIDLKPLVRLIAQVFTTILALYFIGGVDALQIGKIQIASPFVILPVAVIGVVWFINLFNFLDGIDGYASLEALVITLVMFIITGNPICIVLLASILGFIPWNWPKAKIFMGDVGSTQLGFILVVLGLYFHNEAELSIIHWIILSSLFWFDATLTLFRRWKNKETLSVAHKKHAYQRIVQSGFSHKKTICYSLIINLVIISFVFISIYFKALLIPLFIINVLFLYGITLLIDRRVPFR